MKKIVTTYFCDICGAECEHGVAPIPAYRSDDVVVNVQPSFAIDHGHVTEPLLDVCPKCVRAFLRDIFTFSAE